MAQVGSACGAGAEPRAPSVCPAIGPPEGALSGWSGRGPHPGRFISGEWPEPWASHQGELLGTEGKNTKLAATRPRGGGLCWSLLSTARRQVWGPGEQVGDTEPAAAYKCW